MKIRKSKEHEGDFLENRNIVKPKYGLIAAMIPKTYKVGEVNPCVLILVAKLFVDSKGERKLAYHKYLEEEYSEESLNSL